MHTYYFEKLEVWVLSKQFTTDIYKITKGFPNSELYGIVSQLRRAAVSIPTNLSEGSGRKTNKDQAHYTTMAYSSSMEVLNLLHISLELEYVSDEQLKMLRLKIEHITNKLNGLRNAQINRNNGD